jgi:hypothetical protein
MVGKAMVEWTSVGQTAEAKIMVKTAVGKTVVVGMAVVKTAVQKVAAWKTTAEI